MKKHTVEHKEKIPESSDRECVRLSKKVPKGAVSLLNGNTHKDAL